jgi:molybdopterin molybdotransferase
MKLEQAIGLTLAESVRAPMPVPAFTNSAMDGFAVRAVDITAVPARLDVVATIAAGTAWKGCLRRGQAAKIMTGAPLPSGADTVVRREDTRAGEGWVEILVTTPRGEAMRKCGADLAKGRVALPRGTRLGPAELTIIASLGIPRVKVHRRPRIAILASGSELRTPGQKLRAGEIYESSSHAMVETLRSEGAEVDFLGIVRDDRAETRRMIKRGLRADILLTAGGVSVGEYDFVREALQHAGTKEVFWRVAQRPGKPLVFAVRDRTLVFGLPGNPVSSLVSVEMYVKPALRKIMSWSKERLFPPSLRAAAAERIQKPTSLRTFHRGVFEMTGKELTIRLTRSDQSSGLFSTMVGAHALLNLPPGLSVIDQGEMVDCFVLNSEALVRTMKISE